MKKMGFVLLLSLTSMAAKAQNGPILKMQLLPGHVYTSVNKTHKKESIEYVGDTAVVNQMKMMGPPKGFEYNQLTTIDNSVTQQLKHKMKFVMHTKTGGTERYTNSKGVVSDERKSADDRQGVIYGTYGDSLKINIDSISNNIKDEKFKATKVIYTEWLHGSQAYINFPQRALKTGDTFVDNGVIYTPGAGLLDKMRTKTTYTLTAIQNEKAFFDTRTEVSINMEGRQIVMKITGGGTGKMVYDMGINYPVVIQNNINVSYTVKQNYGPNIKMNGSLVINSDQKNTVTF